MKVVGNCPECGNPIWASSPEDTKRTCFCIVTQKTAPITINPQPYVLTPYVQPLKWPNGTWTTTVATQGTTGATYTVHPPKPPDDDGALVS